MVDRENDGANAPFDLNLRAKESDDLLGPERLAWNFDGLRVRAVSLRLPFGGGAHVAGGFSPAAGGVAW